MALGLLMAWVLAAATPTSQSPTLKADPPRSGSIAIRLVDAPTATQEDPQSQRYIIDHLAPGTVIHRRVEVSNTDDAPRRVSIYAAGARIHKRLFEFIPDSAGAELSGWTTTSEHELTLQPYQRSMITVTITVPRNASSGERYGVVWAETAVTPPPGGGIAQVNRVGIRIYLSVGPGGPPSPDFTIGSLSAQRSADGNATVLAQVRNTGVRALDLSGDLMLLEGPSRLTAGPFEARLRTTLAPGDSGPVGVSLGAQLPDGAWLARLRLRSGSTERTAQATIRFHRDPGAESTIRVETVRKQPIEAIVGVLVVPVLLALVATTGRLILRNRRSCRGLGDTSSRGADLST